MTDFCATFGRVFFLDLAQNRCFFSFLQACLKKLLKTRAFGSLLEASSGPRASSGPFVGFWASSQPFLGLGASSGPFLGFWTSSQPFLGLRVSSGALSGLFPTLSGPEGLFGLFKASAQNRCFSALASWRPPPAFSGPRCLL